MSVTYLPLAAWHKHWMLDDLQVRCRGCGGSQDLMAAETFRHALGCHAWGRQAQYPGRELMAHLDRTIQAGLC
jgi:hypothetical protein